SKKGRAFSGKNAECIFIGAPLINDAKQTVKKLRDEAKKAGRLPEEIKILTMLTPIVGRTEKEAIEKYNDYKSHISHEGALALVGGWPGMDLSEYKPNESHQHEDNDSIRTAVDRLTWMD